MFGKKPLYKITDYNGKVLLFMYEYSEDEMVKDRHRNGLSHYQYFKEQVLSIIKRDYDTVSCIKTMELTTTTYLKFLWHNLWSRIDNMITVIPALKASYNVYKLSKLENVERVLDSIYEDYKLSNKNYPKPIDFMIAADGHDLERFIRHNIVYNGCIVGLIHNDNSMSIYIYNNGKYHLLDTALDYSEIIDDNGNLSQYKT